MSRRRHADEALREHFDEAFYRAQAGASLADGDDPVEHYLTAGGRQGWSPHPLFKQDFYLANSEAAAQSDADPFVDFLVAGSRRGDAPHPLFVTRRYLRQQPGAADHPLGAWGHFLANDQARWPHPDGDSMGVRRRGGQAWADVVGAATLGHLAVPDHRGFQRIMDDFDHEAGAILQSRMADVVRDLRAPPTVSVIVPTKDRAHSVGTAIESIRSQTYPHWELVVVDDGGSDDTAEVVAAFDDPRISYVYQENTGVAGARNHGVRHSSGELLAFLDSDNTWVPEFLATMVGFLRTEGLRAAYCASELRSDNRVQYRGRALDVAALRERNYIDCITLTFERALLPALGGAAFDERLRRVVDWDLLIRLAEVTPLGYAPFVGTSYDLWEDHRGDRISYHESIGYRFVVRGKHLVDWQAAPAIEPGLASIVMSVPKAPAARSVVGALSWARRLRESGLVHELVIVDQGLADMPAIRLRVLEQVVPDVLVLRLPDGGTRPLGRNWAAAHARGDVLVVTDPDVEIESADLAVLVERARGRAPAIVQPHIAKADDGRTSQPGTTDGRVFAIDAESYRALGGMDPLFVRGGADADLGLRAAQRGILTLEGDVEATARQPAEEACWVPTAEDQREFTRRWGS
ncbi:MAG: glycosyltransferase [Nocardioides sp.]